MDVSAPTGRMCFPFSQSVDPEVFQKIPNDTGMDSFPKVRSEDAKAHRTWESIRPVPGGALGSAVFCGQRALIPASDNSRVVRRH